MKFIFLDVDGVLNNIHTERCNPSGFTGISRKLVKNLASVIRATEAIIILTSDWKIGWESFDFCCSEDAKYLNTELAKEGLKISGKTYDNHVYDQYFEDSLVQMIMFHDFQLSYVDIAGQKWSEVDTVDDLLTAQEIHRGN